MHKDFSASVRARLLNLAKSAGVDFNQVLVRYALERLLSIARTFRDIASVTVDDGIVFDPASVSVDEIRKDAGYGGGRVVIGADLAKARCKTQVDVGFGDVVTPGPVQAVYPVLIKDFPAPRLRTYPVYTVILEKLHAVVLLGMANSRLKDYLDLWVLRERETLDPVTLARAISATFVRRGMAVPAGLPIGLSDEFANDASRQALWSAFMRKNELAAVPLLDIVTALRAKLLPALSEAASVAPLDPG